MVQIRPFSGNSPWEGEAPAELGKPARQEPRPPRDSYPHLNHASLWADFHHDDTYYQDYVATYLQKRLCGLLVMTLSSSHL